MRIFLPLLTHGYLKKDVPNTYYIHGTIADATELWDSFVGKENPHA